MKKAFLGLLSIILILASFGGLIGRAGKPGGPRRTSDTTMWV